MQPGRSAATQVPAFIIESSELLVRRQETGDSDWGKHLNSLTSFLLNSKKKENYELFQVFFFRWALLYAKKGEESKTPWHNFIENLSSKFKHS